MRRGKAHGTYLTGRHTLKQLLCWALGWLPPGHRVKKNKTWAGGRDPRYLHTPYNGQRHKHLCGSLGSLGDAFPYQDARSSFLVRELQCSEPRLVKYVLIWVAWTKWNNLIASLIGWCNIYEFLGSVRSMCVKLLWALDTAGWVEGSSHRGVHIRWSILVRGVARR